MSQSNDSPTPTAAQAEAMKQATAFAYGYSLAMGNRTQIEHYQEQAERLEEDLKLFGCLKMDSHVLKDDYLLSWQAGREKALEELESKAL